MKGIVFVELVSMVEDAIGEDETDELLDNADLPSAGAYTTVGDYDVAELSTIVQSVSDKTAIPVADLQHKFGHHMGDYFQTSYHEVFESKKNSFELLESIEEEIHRDVRKLYPNAELPTFKYHRPSDRVLELTYFSPRRLSKFCLGLIEKTLDYYGETAEISCEDSSNEREEVTKFTISLTS